MSAEALQRERRQMQAKHLWYNVDIRWSDLKDKLEVLAPTGLTRDDIWRHLFLTKQRKNPYEEGCYTGEDVEDVKQKWEDKKHYFEQYCTRRMSLALLALIWREPFLALTLTTLQHFRQLMTQKLYTHVDGRPRKVRTALRGEPFLMYETRLSRMITRLPTYTPPTPLRRDKRLKHGPMTLSLVPLTPLRPPPPIGPVLTLTQLPMMS